MTSWGKRRVRGPSVPTLLQRRCLRGLAVAPPPPRLRCVGRTCACASWTAAGLTRWRGRCRSRAQRGGRHPRSPLHLFWVWAPWAPAGASKTGRRGTRSPGPFALGLCTRPHPGGRAVASGWTGFHGRLAFVPWPGFSLDWNERAVVFIPSAYCLERNITVKRKPSSMSTPGRGHGAVSLGAWQESLQGPARATPKTGPSRPCTFFWNPHTHRPVPGAREQLTKHLFLPQ